jgi:hypothetical protein
MDHDLEHETRTIWLEEARKEATGNNPLVGYCKRVSFVRTSCKRRKNHRKAGTRRKYSRHEVEFLKFLPSGKCVQMKDLHTPGLDALAEEVFAGMTIPPDVNPAQLFWTISESCERCHMGKNKKQSGLNIKFDLGIFLLITGALSNVTIWVGAFVATESQGSVSVWVRNIFLPVLGGVSGLAMGITVAVGLVYVIAKLNEMKPTHERKIRGKDEWKSTPNIRFYSAWSAIVMLLVISPALLAPYVYMTISGAESMFQVLGEMWAGVWSVGRIVAADLAMGAVALVHGVHLGASAPVGQTASTAKGATETAAHPTRTPKGAKGTASTAADLRPCNVDGCKISYRWPQGKGAHYKKHHPDLVIQKGIPAGMSLPLKENYKVEKGT